MQNAIEPSNTPSSSLDNENPLRSSRFPASLTAFKAAILAVGGMVAAGAAIEAEDAHAAGRIPETPRTAPMDPGSGKLVLAPGLDGPAQPSFTVGIPGFPIDLPSAQELLESAQKKAKALLTEIERAAATKQAVDRVAKDFDLQKTTLTHLAPGLVEFEAKKGGLLQRYVATGTDIFVVRECATERERQALSDVEKKIEKASGKIETLAKEIEAIPALRSDFEVVRWSDSLERIDTKNMRPAHKKLLEDYVSLYSEREKLQSEERSWREACGTRGLELYGRGPAQKAIMITSSGGESYQIVILGGSSRPERVISYTKSSVKHEDVIIDDAVKALVRNDSETYGKVVRCGQFAAPALKDLLEGRLEVPEKDRPAAQLVGGYLLARLKDETAIEPLMKIVRGQVRPKDGYTRKNEVTGILLSMGPAVKDEMRDYLRDPNPKARILAIKHFQKHPDEGVVEDLRGLLEDRDKYVRRHAALALAARRDDKAVAPLVSLLEQNVPDMSDDAAIFLGCYGTRDTLAALNEALADPLLAKYAAKGLSRTNHPDVVKVLRTHAIADATVQDVSEGLLRWAHRGSAEARDGMILGSLNPNATKEFREKVELQLITLSPELEKELPDLAKRMLRAIDTDAPEWHKPAYETFVAARSLGIEFVNRIPEDYRSEILQNRLNPKKDDRPLAIMICARGDHNGAFYLSHTLFSGLCSHNYRVMYYEAGSDQELIASLKDAAALGTANEQKASIIIFGGHGSQSSLHLERGNVDLPDNRGILDPADQETLEKAKISECLADGGFVVLDSCSNGEGGAQADGQGGRPLNMANFMRRIFPNAKENGIFSAMESYGPIELIFDAENRLQDVRYPVPQYRAKLEGRPEIEPIARPENDITAM